MSPQRSEAIALEACWAASASMLLVSLASMRAYPAALALASGLMASVPLMLRELRILRLPWQAGPVIGVPSLLHALGIMLDLYDAVWWWDVLTHMASSMAIAAMVLICLPIAAPKLSASAPSWLLRALTVAAVAAAGAAWETAEFMLDGMLAMNMQFSLDDTATDLTFDVLAAAIVSIAAPLPNGAPLAELSGPGGSGTND